MSGVRPGGVEDRYVAPLEANRRGAHRARPNPLLGVLPLVAVAAVVVAVAGGVVALVGGGGLLPSGKEKTVAGSTIATSKPAASASKPAASASTPAAQPSKSVAPSKSADPSPSDSATDAAGTVDKTVKVTVHNSTSTGGLAKKTTGKLKDAGWTGAGFATGQSASVPQTIVYYASSDLKATAEALVEELGVGVAKQTSKTSRTDGSIGVFISTDYKG